jgi:transcriptional regulator of NAD metabolism
MQMLLQFAVQDIGQLTDIAVKILERGRRPVRRDGSTS